MNMNLSLHPRRRQRGNAMLEFGLAMGVLFPIFAGTFQYGYIYYVYDSLESSIRAAGRYASTRTYNSVSATPSAAYVTAVRNMAVYGNPAGGTSSVAPGLTPAHISVTATFWRGTPSTVTVQVNNYQISGVFGNVNVNGKPRIKFPLLGRWDPVI
jgi:Flp pilus assembly protein TadG